MFALRAALPLLLLLSCAVPEPQRRLRADVEASIGRADPAAGARRYVEYRDGGGEEDAQALTTLAVSTLDEALRASDPATRLAAIRAAEDVDAQALFEPVTRLLGDDDESVRAAAAGAVLKGHPDAPGVLTAALHGSDPRARAMAVTALGKKVGEPAGADLRAALADPDARVREAAVMAVIPFAADEDRRRFDEMAAHDQAAGVRARALGGATEAAARKALDDTDLGVRIAAVDAIARSLGEAANPILAPLAAGGDPIMRLHAARHLTAGDLGADIAAAATSEDWTVRAAAANAATKDAPPPAALVKDADPRVALAAARVLVRVGRSEEARDALAAGLALDDAGLRLDAASDLARLGDPRGEETLAALVPELGAAALAGFPHRRPVARPILVALSSEDRSLRVAAAHAILQRVR